MNNRGNILLAWFISMLVIAVFAFVYFSLMGPMFAIINFTQQQSSSPQVQATANIYANSFLWSSIVFLLGMCAYPILYARRKEYDVTSGR
jgi:hypothetical protein